MVLRADPEVLIVLRSRQGSLQMGCFIRLGASFTNILLGIAREIQQVGQGWLLRGSRGVGNCVEVVDRPGDIFLSRK